MLRRNNRQEKGVSVRAVHARRSGAPAHTPGGTQVRHGENFLDGEGDND